MWLNSILCLVFLTFGSTFGYKAVYMIHGLNQIGVDDNLPNLKRAIQQHHLGTEVLSTSLCTNIGSMDNMFKQLEILAPEFLNFSKSHPEGIHLIGFNQGGLLARGLLELYPDHNVRTFISIAAPQAGVWGIDYIRDIVATPYGRTKLENVLLFFYASETQKIVSVANYWRDPRHKGSYYEVAEFLPRINNEIPHNKSEEYKRGIVKLNKLVLLGSPDDDRVVPPESSHFGFWNEFDLDGSDEDQPLKLIPLKESRYYAQDTLGLKTLDKKGSLVVDYIPGIKNAEWVNNPCYMEKYVVPHLD